jgi:hypothetical protein
MDCCGFFGESSSQYALSFDIKYPFGLLPDEYTENRDRINEIIHHMGYDFVHTFWLSPVTTEAEIIGDLVWNFGDRPDICEMLDELTIIRVAGPPVDILRHLQYSCKK